MPIRDSGFSLVEVLVAITIIAVVSAIAIPNFHKFNQSTIVKNAANDLANSLKTAQTNIQTGVKCPSGKFPSDWDIMIQSNGYFFRINCFDQTNATPSYENQTPVTFPQGVTASSESCSIPANPSAGGQAVNFFPNYSHTFDCGFTGTFAVNISDGSNSSLVQIDPGGNITVN